MIVKLDDRFYTVQFSHKNNHQFPKFIDLETEHGSIRYYRKPEPSVTTCKITAHIPPKKEGDVTFPLALGVGKAICSTEDQFVKAKGRVLALKDVLDQLDFGKDFNTAVWNEYNIRMKTP